MRFALVALLLAACTSAPKERERGRRVESPPTNDAEWMFQNGKLGSGWQDQGVASRKIEAGKALEVDLKGQGSFQLVNAPQVNPGAVGVIFNVLADPAFGDFLEVRLDSSRADVFPRVTVGPQHRREMTGNWSEVYVPMTELNPKTLPFDRVVFRAKTATSAPIYFDRVALVRSEAKSFELPTPGTGPTASQKSKEPARVEAKSFAIDCFGKTHPINPMIYGIAVNVRMDEKHPWLWSLNPGARRWGGNPMSRYNWELGTAWNTGADYYFKNTSYGGNYSYRNFIRDNLTHDVKTALTVPMLGWVARDTHSSSFPTSEFGYNMRSTDPEEHRAGDGYTKNNTPIQPGPPGRTSIQASPAFIGKWIEQIRAQDRDRRNVRGVHHYILDNEPELWDSTHRDVHPEPVSYDELMQRTIEYGTEIRKHDPGAIIAGPASWGWTGYWYSGADAAAGFDKRPDRKKHGDMPLIAWYLQKLKEHEDKTGTRILDVLDVHFYPAPKGVFGENAGTDPLTAALRIRTTRALWDALYMDESWIKDTVKLIPRLREWITIYYPGRGISIGEWNFGAETHMSGGLAVAEALGRYGEQGITSAYYWTYPPENSPAYWAFRAYRDFDGKKSTFLDHSVPTRAPNGASIFAARNEQRTKMTAVLLNFSPDAAIDARIDAGMCGKIVARKTYTYAGDANGFHEAPLRQNDGEQIQTQLPPYSITVLSMDVQPARK